MKQISLVFAALTEGFATSKDISDEIGLPAKVVSNHLSQIFQSGLTDRRRENPTGKPGRRSFMYTLKRS